MHLKLVSVAFPLHFTFLVSSLGVALSATAIATSQSAGLSENQPRIARTPLPPQRECCRKGSILKMRKNQQARSPPTPSLLLARQDAQSRVPGTATWEGFSESGNCPRNGDAGSASTKKQRITKSGCAAKPRLRSQAHVLPLSLAMQVR